jgi:glycosyltransferase involved in cell wall biosynthesis
MDPAIVIPAYNRPQTLERLLSSLRAGDYPRGVKVPLVISIDPGQDVSNQQVRDVAESFVWSNGPKEIILHKDHLGLLGNFHFCGSLTRTYGSAIFLEDDLLVSRGFYDFAVQSLEYYADDPRISGISLYSYEHNGYTHFPFVPLADGSDVFFMQLPSILGQVWSERQWDAFAAWRMTHFEGRSAQNGKLHDLWSQFDADDYFPILTSYLVFTNRFYVFPRLSHSTGFGDKGVHFKSVTSYFQAPLQRNHSRYRLHTLDEADSVYDSFMELSSGQLKRLVPLLSKLDFEVDLNATKRPHNLLADYVLTTRACQNPLQSFALSMRPAEANLIFNLPGEGISLCRRSDVLWDGWNDLQTSKRLYDYHMRRRVGLRQILKYLLLDLLKRAPQWKL